MTIKKNDRLYLSFTHWGPKGLAETDGVLVPYACPGDAGLVHIVKATADKSYGKLIELTESSPNRVEPACSIFGKCGGCHLQHVTYSEQLAYKRMRLKQTLQLEKDPDVIRCPNPFNYRNKAQFTISGTDIGLSAPRSQRIIDCDSCAIQHPLTNQVLVVVRKHLLGSDLTQLITRVGVFTGELMVGLVSDKTPSISLMIEELKGIPELKSLYLNHNPDPEWQVMGDSETLLWGEPRITEVIGGLRLSLSLRSFFQNNPYQIETLWKTVLALCQGDSVLDLYCGSGGMSLYLALQGKDVVGIENHPEALKDAAINKQINQGASVRFIEGDVTALETLPSCDTLIVDPPRSGLSDNVIEAILAQAPRQVIYISCMPETLARDLSKLHGYRIETTILVDLFPQTHHAESVVSLVLE